MTGYHSQESFCCKRHKLDPAPATPTGLELSFLAREQITLRVWVGTGSPGKLTCKRICSEPSRAEHASLSLSLLHAMILQHSVYFHKLGSHWPVLAALVPAVRCCDAFFITIKKCITKKNLNK